MYGRREVGLPVSRPRGGGGGHHIITIAKTYHWVQEE